LAAGKGQQCDQGTSSQCSEASIHIRRPFKVSGGHTDFPYKVL
jgi:hypothetical protein